LLNQINLKQSENRAKIYRIGWKPSKINRDVSEWFKVQTKKI
jgi:hypothetical protein